MNKNLYSDDSTLRPSSPEDDDYIEPNEFPIFKNLPVIKESIISPVNMESTLANEALEEEIIDSAKYQGKPEKYIKSVLTENCDSKINKITRNITNQLAERIIGDFQILKQKFLIVEFHSIKKKDSWRTQCDPHSKYKVIDRIGQG
jgi:hypothetical protein